MVLTFILLFSNNTVDFSQYDFSVSQKEHPTFRLDQKPQLVFNVSDTVFAHLKQRIKLVSASENSELKTELLDSNQSSISAKITVSEIGLGSVMATVEDQSLPPGKYTLKVTDPQTGEVLSQDYYWGVLAINSNKATYASNEKAQLSIAVLDDKGYMVCDARVFLEIRDPKGHKTLLSTDGRDIQVNEQCSKKAFSLIPDYETSYQTSIVGTYEMKLTAITKNGSFEIKDLFKVKSPKETEEYFDIERITATRIYPYDLYPVVLKITPNRDYTGPINDYLPTSFIVNQISKDDLKTKYSIDVQDKEYNQNLEQRFDQGKQIITFNVNLKKGEPYYVGYTYDAPDESPKYYTLGPVSLGSFKESRVWQLAVDASGDLILLWDGGVGNNSPGTVNGTTWTCISCTAGDPYLDVYPYGASSYSSTTAGAATHTHTVSYVSETITASNSFRATGSNTVSTTHTHGSITINSGQSDSNDPSYRSLKFIRSSGTPTTIPSGVIALFDTTTMPNAAWDLYTSQNTYFLKGSSTIATGGNNSDSHSINGTTGQTSNTYSALSTQSAIGATTTHTHTCTGTASIDKQPPFIEVVFGKANTNTTIPVGMISMFDAAAPTGWTRQSTWDNRFLKGNTTSYGTTGGNGTHQPSNLALSCTATTSTSSTFRSGTAGGANYNHTHNVTVSFNSVANLPVYRNTVFAKKDNTITISGNIYASGSESSLDTLNTYTVAVSVSNAAPTTQTNITTGTYSISIPTPGGPSHIAVYLSGHANDANSFTYWTSGDVSNFHLYVGKVAIGNNSGSSTSNATMCTIQNSYPPAGDKLYSCPTYPTNNNIQLTSNTELHVLNGKTYAPGANLTTQGTGGLHVDTSATFTGGTTQDHVIAGAVTTENLSTLTAPSTVNDGTLRVGGAWNMNSGATFTSGSGKVIFTATSGSYNVAGVNQPFYDLNFGETSGTATWNLSSGTLNVDGSLVIDYGTLSEGAWDVNTAGAVTINANGNFTAGNNGWTFNGTGSANYTDNRVTKAYLGAVHINADSGTRTVSLQTAITMKSIHVYSDGVFTMNGQNVTLGNTTDPYTGAIIVDAGGVTSQSSGSVTILSNSDTTTWTGTGTFTCYNLYIGNGTNTFTVNNNGASPLNLSMSHDFSIYNHAVYLASTTANLYVYNTFNIQTGATFTHNNGTLTMRATDVNDNWIYTSGSSLGNLTFDGSGGTYSFGDANETVAGNFTIKDVVTSVLAPSGTLYVAGDFTTNYHFSHNNGTVNFNGAAGTTQTIVDENEFYNLTITTAGTRTIKFGAVYAQIIRNNLTLTGTDCNNLLILRSDITGTQYSIEDVTGGTTSVSFVDVQDGFAGNGDSITAANSVNSGNNSYWNITANACKGASTDANATAYSFQRKTFYDTTNQRYWLFYYDGNQIEIRYSSDNTTWTVINTLAYNTNDFSVWNKNIDSTEYVFLAVITANDIRVLRGTLSSTDISWDNTSYEQTPLDGSNSNNTYSYPYISLDSNNYIWILARYFDGANYVVKTIDSTSLGSATWDATFAWNATSNVISSTSQTNANVYGNIVPLTGGEMYAAFVENTTLKGCKWVDGTTNAWQDKDGNACTTTAGAGDTEGLGTRSTAGAVKIDDASNFISGTVSNRSIVTVSSGTLYAVTHHPSNIEVWKSTDGSSWTEQDSAHHPSSNTGVGVAVAVDKSDILHIVYASSSGATYVTFNTATSLFGTPEAITGLGSYYVAPAIAIDYYDKPHIVFSNGSTYARYSNRISGSWLVGPIIVASGNVLTTDIVIDQNNVPQVACVVATGSLYVAIGNANNPTSFSGTTVDGSVNGTNGQGKASIAVDDKGNTWIAYVDATTNYITLVEKLYSTGSWQTPVSNSNPGYQPSITIIGKTIFVFYEALGGYISIVYDAYDSGISQWNGWILLSPAGMVSYGYPKVRYSKYNFNTRYYLDYTFSDGTDMYWNVLDVRTRKINDASNFGSIPAQSRQTVRNSKGFLYTFLNNSGACQLWKSTDGYVWKQIGSNVNCNTNSGIGLAVDASDTLHISYSKLVTFDYNYIRYNTINSSDSWGTESDVTTLSTNTQFKSVQIAVDSNNKPHLIYSYSDFDLNKDYIYYTNHTGMIWSAFMQIATVMSPSADILIDASNYPVVTYVSGTTLYAKQGDANNPSSFASYTADNSVNSTLDQRGCSSAIDTLTGDLWLAYIDSGGTVSLAKHTGATWTSNWSTVTTKTDIGYEPSIAITGASDIYVLYQEDSSDQKIVYDKYTAGATTPAWSGETILQTPGSGVDYSDVHVKWSYLNNNFSPNRLDFAFSDGTDVYYNYLYLRRMPSIINDTGNDALEQNTGRKIVRNSKGILYSVTSNYTSADIIQMWKSLDEGVTWELMDSADEPISSSANNFIQSTSIAIDHKDIIHVLFDDGTDSDPVSAAIRYTTFDTIYDQWLSVTTIDSFSGAYSGFANDLAIDANGIPHIVYGIGLSPTYLKYANRIGGSWTTVQVDTVSTVSSCSITIDEDNLPEISYVDYGTLTAAVGQDNDPDTAGQWTLNDIDLTVSTLYGNHSSIGIDSAGNTWVAYIDLSPAYITLYKHSDASAWTSGWTQYTDSKIGTNVSLSIDDTTVYVFYIDEQNDVVNDTFDGINWKGETIIEMHNSLGGISPQWSFINSYDSLANSRNAYQTYYFNGNYINNNTAWGSPSNAFDTTETTYATTTTLGSSSSNFLQGLGTSASSLPDKAISGVTVKMYGIATNCILATQIYSASLGELLGTTTLYPGESGWSGMGALSTPSGGWTWQKVKNLESKSYIYNGSSSYSGQLGKIEITVHLTSVAPKAIDYVYQDANDVWQNRLIISSASVAGSQDTIDAAVPGNDLTKNLSLVADSSGNAHIIYIDDEATDQVSYRLWTGATKIWGSATQIDQSNTDAFASLTIETGTNDLYAFYIDTSNYKIYYRQYDLSATSWAPEVEWKSTNTNKSITSNYSGSSQVFAEWQIGSTNVSIAWDRLTFGGGNNAPTVTGVTLNGNNTISITEGSTLSVSWTATVSDADGSGQIASVTGKAYRSGVTNAQACTPDNNNCYSVGSCNLSGCGGNSCTATCTATMYFYAEPTDAGSPYPSEYWRAWMRVTDTQSATGDGWSGVGTPDMASVVALDVTSSITYGTIIAGDNTGSGDHHIVVTNTGNRAIDSELKGDDMCTDYPTCVGQIITVGYQEHSLTSFSYSSGTDLTKTNFKVNINLAKPTTSPSNSTANIYWEMGIPVVQSTGVYSGKNYVFAVADT